MAAAPTTITGRNVLDFIQNEIKNNNSVEDILYKFSDSKTETETHARKVSAFSGTGAGR